MARRKAEIDLLGVASKEELMKFEVAKEVDKPLAKKVAEINNKKETSNFVTEEELLRIRKKGEQEILDIQNELKEFKMNEERMISFLPIEEEEEEEVYIPTRKEIIIGNLKKPFIKLVDKYDSLSGKQKFNILKSIIIILLVLIAVSLTIFAVQKRTLIYKDYIKLDLEPVGAGHYDMPNASIFVGGEEVILTKIVIDGLNTVLTFDRPVNINNNYSVNLIDNDGVRYYTDKHYMRNLRSSDEGRILAFEPFLDGVQEFELEILNMISGESTIYKFRLKKFLEKSDYIELYNTENLVNTGLNLNSFYVTASGSILEYSLSSVGENYTYKVIDQQGIGSGIYQNMNIIPSKQKEIEVYEFPQYNSSVYQEAYYVPRDLNGEVEFIADNIFKSYEVNQIYTRDQVREGFTLDFDDFSLVIEGIKKQGDMAILVYHVEDNSYKPTVQSEDEIIDSQTSIDKSTNFNVYEEKIEDTNRVYALLDVDIVTVDGYGNAVAEIEPSKINASNEGADVVFVDDRLSQVVGNYGVRINSVNIRDTIYHGYIDLSENGKNSDTDEEFKNGLENIKEAFRSRQEYRAAISPRNKMVYFSDDILNDRDMMGKYIPLNVDKPASYSSEIISSINRKNYIFAIVEDNFIGSNGNVVIDTSTIHKVVYDLDKEEIIVDEIISEINNDIIEGDN